VSSQGQRKPLSYIRAPVCAIITPLSMQNLRTGFQSSAGRRSGFFTTVLNYLSSVAYDLAPLSAHMISIIVCSLSLQPTPPTISTSFEPQCAIALSARTENNDYRRVKKSFSIDESFLQPTLISRGQLHPFGF
jgi:hypothetical protein